jgi:hypothetical protein
MSIAEADMLQSCDKRVNTVTNHVNGQTLSKIDRSKVRFNSSCPFRISHLNWYRHRPSIFVDPPDILIVERDTRDSEENECSRFDVKPI